MKWLLRNFSLAILCAGLFPAAPAFSQTTYIDRFAGSVVATGIKAPVAAATTVAISLTGQQTINGVAITQGQRVLVKNQADQTTNGIYIASLGPWIRAQDFSGPSGVVSGQLVINNGGTQAGLWQLTSVDPVCIDQTGGSCSASNITFSSFVPGVITITTGKVMSNISGITALPVGNTLTAVLDNVLGSTQGQLLYRNGSIWTVLNPGLSGQLLSSGGTAANPSWVTASGTGTLTSLATNNGLTGGTITTSGTIGLAPIGTNQILANPTSGSTVPIGTSLSTEIDAALGSTRGALLERGSGAWALLNPSSSAGTVLTSNGTSADPSYQALTTSAVLHHQVFTSSGIFTAPIGTTSGTVFKLTITGGGGSGSDHTFSCPLGGGGGGATDIVWASGLTASTGYMVTIGAGGATGSHCASGGDSTVVIGAATYKGGGGLSTPTTNAGGTAVNGDILISGGNGIGFPDTTSGTYDGGFSYWGSGGRATAANACSVGVNPGSGGSSDNGTDQCAGAAGKVVVEWVL